MCGIAGVLSREPLADGDGLAACLDDRLAHRGPDGRGRFDAAGGRLLLVHRRLAIIDPSPRGAQPMASPDGRHHIVYNGEIYNHREVRAELEAEGERFATASDTEVLLRLLVRHGPDALARLRGMFALALWDDTAGTLLVARDRFGIKPLYVARQPGRVGFASEIRALTASGLAAREPDPAGVLAYLRWGSVPAPLTWMTGVEALPPGTWRRFGLDGAEHGGAFVDLREAWCDGPSAPRTIERLSIQHALEASVAAHLVADVPVGVFLSGGLDSTALVAAASRLRPRRLDTFTVAVDDARLDEARYAEGVATRFGTRHHTLRVDAHGILRDWPAILASLDQPTNDAVNTFYVARAVAETGIKAVLSGVGGDELFGGYPSFRRLPRALRWTRRAGPAARWGARAMAAAGPGWRAAKWRHAAASGGAPIELYRSLRGFLMPDEVAACAGPRLRDVPGAYARADAVEAETMAPACDERPEATVARLETTMYMRAQLLRDVDAVSMAHGLEVRVPFVDAPLVDALWPALAYEPRWLRGKRLLAAAAGAELPPEVSRPKQTFTLPFDAWMTGPLGPVVWDGLAALETDGWTAPGTAVALLTRWRARQVHWSRPWGLAVLGHMLHA
ncbi:MAG: asparagine synthase (glutamine-hydrolyzing) [Vicinamibacterales bacterium]